MESPEIHQIPGFFAQKPQFFRKIQEPRLTYLYESSDGLLQDFATTNLAYSDSQCAIGDVKINKAGAREIRVWPHVFPDLTPKIHTLDAKGFRDPCAGRPRRSRKPLLLDSTQTGLGKPIPLDLLERLKQLSV